MKQYLECLDYILKNGVKTHNRTGIDTIAVSGLSMRFNMADGFPIITCRKAGYKYVAAELEMFIKGVASKKFLHERKCHIWDSWCSPQKIPYGNDEETKKKMFEEDDLGRIYGVQWRDFGGDPEKGIKGYDQLKVLIDTIKKDPTSRRLLVSAWNPIDLDKQALPPCHIGFQILCYPEQKLMDLIWVQRSADFPVGIPADISSYAMLLMLIAKETDYTPRTLIGNFGSCHIYENQIEGTKELLKRKTYKLPQLKINNWKSIWDWKYSDMELIGYESEAPIKFEVAV